MFALTLHEPWATLIARKVKMVETRSWRTHYRGPIAIHAGKSERFVSSWSDLWLEASGGIPGCAPEPPKPWPFGQIIAIANLAECVPTEQAALALSTMEKAFGNYKPGRWAWKFDRVRKLERPLLARGFQMLWTVPVYVATQLEQINGGLWV